MVFTQHYRMGACDNILMNVTTDCIVTMRFIQ